MFLPHPVCSVRVSTWAFTTTTSTGITASTELHLWFLSLSFLPFHLTCFLQYSHLQKFQCIDLSDVFVGFGGNSFLNYSCPTCNYKRRDLEAITCCYAVIILFYCWVIFNCVYLCVCVCVVWVCVGGCPIVNMWHWFL